jgi:hypothetical protein
MSIKGVELAYIGNASLTAVGPVTGRRYKFAAHGAVVAVDPHDVPALLQVPNLVRRPSPFN